MNGFGKYIANLSFFGILVFAIYYVLSLKVPVLGNNIELFIGLFLFFYIFSATLHLIMLNLSKKSPGQFVAYFMGLTGLKLFVYLLLLIVLLSTLAGSKIVLIGTFFYLYIVFTTYEVIALLKHKA